MRTWRRSVAAFLLCLIAATTAAAGYFVRAAPERTELAAREWRQDLKFIARELPRRHPNAFHHSSRYEFERAVADLDRRIPELGSNQIIIEMVRLVSMVGDLHTRLLLPKSFRRLPFEVEWFGNELRITAAVADYRPLLGARILAMDSAPVEQVDSSIRPLIPQAENDWTYKALTPLYIVRLEVLQAVGAVGSPERIRLRVAHGSEDPAEHMIEPLRPLDARNLVQIATAPRHLVTNRDASFWWTQLDEPTTLYVRFRGYEHIGLKTKELSGFIEANPTRRIIIDMRDNMGGDFTKVREHLIPAIGKSAPSAKLYVIIGRRTMSAAMVNAIDFRTQLGAVLVGEPTGGRPNSYQEGRQVRLPNSGLMLSYSTRYYRFTATDTPAVQPDMLVTSDWESYRQGRDRALEAITGATGPA